MNFTTTKLLFVAVLLSAGLVAPEASIAQANVPLSKRVADMVALTKGPTLYGVVVEQSRKRDTKLMVSRAWLKANEPQLYAARIKAESTQLGKQREILKQRIEQWIGDRSQPQSTVEDKQLVQTLKMQLRQLKDAKTADNKLLQFFEFQIDGKNVRRTFRQPATRRMIGAWAWHERIANVESRSLKDLQKELVARGINDFSRLPSLADRLPVTEETDEQWAIRKALFEYQFRKPVDFQGTGDFLVAADGELNGAEMMNLLQNQMQSQLSGLLSEINGNGFSSAANQKSSGLKRARELAEKQNAIGFRVTTTDQNLTTNSVVVKTTFYAKTQANTWKPVFSTSETGKATANKQGQQLKSNPQVAQILKFAEQFGATEGMIQTALDFGAVTQKAQQTVDGTFREWLDPYLRRLDSPALRIGKPTGK